MAIINGTSVGDMTLQADYSYTQNTSANTSTVTVVLKLYNHYALYATALTGSYISVGGSKTNYSKSISYGGSGTTTTELARKTVTVTHNSDGTATCNISGTFVMNGTYRGSTVGTMTVNQTITLPKIARSSSFTVSSSVNTGSAISGTVTPSSTSFNHKIQLKIGSTVKDTITLAVGTTTFSYTIPHSWFPSSTSGTISAVLQTYNGTTLVATTSKNITANVPASIVPSVSAFTAAIAANGLGGLYVQGKTTAKLTATATAGSGSAIKSYTYNGPNVTSSGNSTSVTANTITTAAIKSSGTLTYTVQVQDNRGRTASKTVSITVQPYSTPTISSVSVQRCDSNGNLSDSGTYARYTVNSSYSTVSGKNTRTVTVAYSSNNGSSYSDETTLQAATDTASTKTGTYGGGAFAVANAYILRFTIKDAYGAIQTITAPLQSASRPINISANGKGVAIGGMSTKNAFEVSMAADFNSSVNIDGKLMLSGGLAGPLSVANGGTGVSTASALARTHIHNDITGASSSGGTLGYLRIARIQITAAYVNQPIEIKFSRRLDSRPTTISLVFHNSANLDPGYAAFVVDGPASAWLYKSGTSIWDIYVQKAESYDYVGILDAKYTNNLAEKLTITFTDVFASAVPSGAIEATKIYNDYVIEAGASGGWTWKKWFSGRMEVYGTASHNPTALNDGVNSMTVTMPVSFVDSNFKVLLTPAKCGLLVTRFGDCASNSDITHTKNTFVLSYRYNNSTAYTVNFNVMAFGGWK